MKKRILIAVLMAAFMIPALIWAAELNNITAAGVNGNLCFYNASGSEIFCVEDTTRLVSYPSGSAVDVESGASLKIAGTAITSTAAEINKLASIGSGDILTTSNTKTVTNKTLSGATFTGTIDGGTFTSSTLTTPVIASLYQASGTNLLTMPAATDTLVGKATTDTFTNKTLSGATLTGTITGGTFTNSTLTTPVIASFYQDAAKSKLMTTPDTASDTLAAIAATQTLTNKTLTSPVVNWGVSSNTFVAGEDWTLSSAEAKSVLLVLASGSGTPSIVDAYSSTGAIKIIRNAANVAVTTKMSGQTGVSIASGNTAVLINSGTDYVRVTADATH